MFIQEKLRELDLPDVLKFKNGAQVKTLEDWEKRRDEVKQIIQENMYGVLPPRPLHLRAEEINSDDGFCAGKATLKNVSLISTFNDGDIFSFPVTYFIPVNRKSVPAILLINFRSDVPDKYLPAEELIDRGYAIFTFNYANVTSDTPDSPDGIYRNLNKHREKSKCIGKIACWAWAAMRVMDMIQSIGCIDKRNIAVAGHSRLGKTALLTAALDDRFAYAISNDSGCCGASLERGKGGERHSMITATFPHWFTPKFVTDISKNAEIEFDQHFLLSLIAPRHLLVGSAAEDSWADPMSEYLCTCKVNEVYALYGKKGLEHPDRAPVPGDSFDDGDNHYHLRAWKHYLSREDWNRYLDFMDKYVNR